MDGGKDDLDEEMEVVINDAARKTFRLRMPDLGQYLRPRLAHGQYLLERNVIGIEICFPQQFRVGGSRDRHDDRRLTDTGEAGKDTKRAVRIIRLQRGEKHVDDSLATQTDADLVIIVAGRIIGDHGWTIQGDALLGTPEGISFQTATADTAQVGAVVEDQHTGARPAIGRAFYPYDGGKRRPGRLKVDGLPCGDDGPDLLHETKLLHFQSPKRRRRMRIPMRMGNSRHSPGYTAESPAIRRLSKGRTTEKTEPLPFSLVRLMVPPCLRTISEEI